MVKTLVDRIGKLKLDQSDDDLIQQLVARGVLTVDRRWNYLAWDPKALTLKPTNREPINSQEMAQILQRLLALNQKPDASASLCSTQTSSTRLSSPGCSSGHSLETRHSSSHTRSERVVEPYPTPVRQWHHPICIAPHPPGWLAEEPPGYGNLDQTEEVIHWIRTHALASKGATCYLTSTLIAQMWTQAMTKSFIFEAWDAWQTPLTRLLQCTALGPLDPCRDVYLGLELRSWFLSYSPLAQYDAGEHGMATGGHVSAKNSTCTVAVSGLGSQT